MTPFWSRPGVQHNSRGYRGVDEFTREPRGTRILAVGDSFTYGLGVEDSATFSAVLARNTGTEVINAGVNAYGADQAFLMWDLKARYLNPAIVILGYFVDDFNRNGLSIRDRAKPHFVYDSIERGFQLKGIPVPTLEELDASGALDPEAQLRVARLVRFLRQRVEAKTGRLAVERLKRNAQINDYILRRMRDSAEHAGARLLVMVIGHCYDGDPENLWIERTIVEACRSNQIEYLNMAAQMRENDFASFYLSNCHWSERGHDFAAEKLADALGLDFREENSTDPSIR